jgi:uncharacterized protein (DUF362 family)
MAYSNNTPLGNFRQNISRVVIRKAATYSSDLADLIFETVSEFHLPVRDKVVLLKPNLVGHDPWGVANTHPAVILAARECFLRLGAGTVLLGEGPATDRDTTAILETVGLREYLGPQENQFVDLNVDDVRCIPLRTRASKLKHLYLPSTVLGADFVVSLPKMKTHHWAGVTLSLKNLFGIVPGCCYGWPKNVLHWAGIGRIVLDLASTIRPDFAIVDGIVGMEGDGPLEGTPKPSGVLVMGDDLVAVDATCARLMGLIPEKVDYLHNAGLLLGNLREDRIAQIGETIGEMRSTFEVPAAFRRLRANGHTAPRLE